MRRRPALIFLHVPKTAGMTLRHVLASRYRPRETFVIGNDINADIRRFVAMEAPRRERIRLLMGHMSFGLHEFLAPGARYVTVLRHPVDRVLSEYRFLKTNARHPLHGQVARMSLEEYLERDVSGQAANGQTRLLSGSHESGSVGIPGRKPLDESSVARALDNIERHFVLAGTQERFEESLLLLARRLGWRTLPFFVVRNVTGTRVSPLAEGEDARERIESFNRLDMALYRAVSELVDRAVADAGPGFTTSLDRFVRFNALYQGMESRRVQYRRRFLRLAGRFLPISRSLE